VRFVLHEANLPTKSATVALEMSKSEISDVFRRRLREVRKARGLTREELAERLREIDYVLEPLTLYRLEAGRKRVALDDVVALAYALSVSPLFLLLPYGRAEVVRYAGVETHAYGDTVEIAPNLQPFGHYSLRDWLRGEEPLPGQDVADFFQQLPPDVLATRIQAAGDVEAGKPTRPGGPALRRAMVVEGEAEPVPTDRLAETQRLEETQRLGETVGYVAALTDEEVIGELGGDPSPFVAWLALREPEDEAAREQLRSQTMRDLRSALVQHHLEDEAWADAIRGLRDQRPNPPSVLPWYRKEE
jgi:transcriptional regulator with XRE-family HTH domain